MTSDLEAFTRKTSQASEHAYRSPGQLQSALGCQRNCTSKVGYPFRRAPPMYKVMLSC
jgi:hypothetical protein